MNEMDNYNLECISIVLNPVSGAVSRVSDLRVDKHMFAMLYCIISIKVR